MQLQACAHWLSIRKQALTLDSAAAHLTRNCSVGIPQIPRTQEKFLDNENWSRNFERKKKQTIHQNRINVSCDLYTKSEN